MQSKFISLFLTIIFCSFTIINNAYSLASNTAKQDDTFKSQMQQSSFRVPNVDHKAFLDHDASTLVISCVDFRFRDEIAFFLNDMLGLKNDYDELTLPGATLALAATEKLPHWSKTVQDIIPLLTRFTI